jgi:nickel transport system substrate-binding protein
MKKGENNFAFTDDRGTDSLDKDSLKQLKETGDYNVKRSQPMNPFFIDKNAVSPAGFTLASTLFNLDLSPQ